MLSFIDARGGGTSLLSSTLMTPRGILFRHYASFGQQQKTDDETRRETHLNNDPQGFSEFLNTAQVPIVAVTILADGDVELHLRQT